MDVTLNTSGRNDSKGASKVIEGNGPTVTLSKRQIGYRLIASEGIVPVFSSPHHETNAAVADALAAAGYALLEVTYRHSAIPELFARLNDYVQEKGIKLTLGAGTIRNEHEAAALIKAGAKFLVGPNFDPAIAELCKERDIPYSPGCGSMTELENASRVLGLPAEECVMKVFPADCVGGPKFIANALAIRGGAEPWRLMPTGGVDVTESNLAEWFEAGAVAVGAGSKLISQKDPDAIRASVKDLSKVREIVRRLKTK